MCEASIESRDPPLSKFFIGGVCEGSLTIFDFYPFKLLGMLFPCRESASIASKLSDLEEEMHCLSLKDKRSKLSVLHPLRAYDAKILCLNLLLRAEQNNCILVEQSCGDNSKFY